MNDIRPAWVLFDYGETLIAEAPFDPVKGFEALLPHATRNPQNLTAKDIERVNQRFYEEMGFADEDIRLSHPPLEVHHHLYSRFLFEFLDLEFDLDDKAAAEVFWDVAAPGTPQPGAAAMLDALHEMGVRTGVVSNMAFSNATLVERIDRILPGNHLAFIITSSDCVFRKPSPILFEYALKRAGVAPQNAWYCGDNFRCDVEGAHAAGMYPVWYRDVDEAPEADFDYLHLRHWDDFAPMLAALPTAVAGK